MQTVGQPRFNDPHSLHRPDLRAETGGGVRQLGRRRNQVLLAVVKQQLTRQDEVSGVGLLLADRAIRLAEEKLSVDIHPRSCIRREQPLL
jgi:hypothetical protein